METVRIGLAGCGLFGAEHLRAFRKTTCAEIVALYDPDTARAKKRAETFGIKKVCGSLEELCATDLDAIDVVTPEDSHVEPVVKALGAGKHVFVEKPLATTITDCETMIAAAEATGRILMPGHILRFHTDYSALQGRLYEGALGPPLYMSARRNRPTNQLGRYASRCHIALVTAIHDIDLMQWFVHSPREEYRSEIEYVAGGQYKFMTGTHEADAFWGELHFHNGAVGRLETNWLLESTVPQPLSDHASMDDEFYLISGGTRFIHESNRTIIHPTPGSYDRALVDELINFCDCVHLESAPMIISPEESRNAVKVALAMIESARHGGEKQAVV